MTGPGRRPASREQQTVVLIRRLREAGEHGVSYIEVARALWVDRPPPEGSFRDAIRKTVARCRALGHEIETLPGGRGLRLMREVPPGEELQRGRGRPFRHEERAATAAVSSARSQRAGTAEVDPADLFLARLFEAHGAVVPRTVLAAEVVPAFLRGRPAANTTLDRLAQTLRDDGWPVEWAPNGGFRIEPGAVATPPPPISKRGANGQWLAATKDASHAAAAPPRPPLSPRRCLRCRAWFQREPDEKNLYRCQNCRSLHLDDPSAESYRVVRR
jgi:biotin operon repressor